MQTLIFYWPFLIPKAGLHIRKIGVDYKYDYISLIETLRKTHSELFNVIECNDAGPIHYFPKKLY